MPVTKQARKKLRQDKKKTIRNQNVKNALKDAIKTAKKNLTGEQLRKTQSLIDKATKNKIIAKNKAARLKSSLSKLIAQKKPHTSTS